jgi:hypothetical protein
MPALDNPALTIAIAVFASLMMIGFVLLEPASDLRAAERPHLARANARAPRPPVGARPGKTGPGS